MTINQLIELLKQYPGDSKVYAYAPNSDEDELVTGVLFEEGLCGWHSSISICTDDV